MIYSIHDNGDLLAADISSPSGNINVISYMPITVQVITRADTFFMIGNNANTELNKYQGELTLFCTGSASYSVYKNNYIAANRLGTASPNTAFNISKNWIGSIFVDDTGTSSAPGEIFKLYIFKGMLSTQECIAKAGFRGEDHVIVEGKSSLPSGYQRLEYIESTGTQWFDGGFTFNDVDTMEGELSLAPNINTYSQLDGARGTTSNYNSFFGIDNTKHLRYLYNGSQSSNRIYIPNQFYKVKATLKPNTQSLYIDNELIKESTVTAPANIPSNFYIFSVNNTLGGTAYPFFGKARRITYIKNNILVRNYISARRLSDGVLGMYDTVSNQFFTNQGTGSFIAGPVVNQTTQRRIQA